MGELKGKQHLWAVTWAKSSIGPLTMSVSVWKKKKGKRKRGKKKNNACGPWHERKPRWGPWYLDVFVTAHCCYCALCVCVCICACVCVYQWYVCVCMCVHTCTQTFECLRRSPLLLPRGVWILVVCAYACVCANMRAWCIFIYILMTRAHIFIFLIHM